MPRLFIIIAALFFLFGCRTTLERRAWEVVEAEHDNQAELIKFLEHYKQLGSRDKYIAACFLVANMPNKYSQGEDFPYPVFDLKVVKADSLINSVEYSFALRDTSSFLSKQSFEEFCEYILPYRVANEPLTYYWKWDCRRRYAHFVNSDPIKTSKEINRRLALTVHPNNYSVPIKSYTSLMSKPYGKCDDRAILLTMICRSLGIPAAYEIIPRWGSHNNGHSFCTVIMGDSAVVALQENENSNIFHRKVSKIYRSMFAMQSCNGMDVPPLFTDCDMMDVTQCYLIGKNDLTFPEATVMCVFSDDGWTPISYDAKGRFLNLGTGTDALGCTCDDAKDMGEGILYLPAVWLNNRINPTGEPLIVSDKEAIRIVADTSAEESVILSRKYPLQKRIVNYAANMVRGIFEAANRSDFSDAETIYSIESQPLCRRQTVAVDTSKRYRYIRYRKPRGIFSIAQMRILDSHRNPIQFLPIGEDAIVDTGELGKVFDNDPLTFVEINGGVDFWVGADLKRPCNVGYIEFAPRNDDNCISPGDLYELFYWDDEWRSLGQKYATDYTLVFEHVPKHALLWLRDLTRGQEERPFTYDNNRQIWW